MGLGQDQPGQAAIYFDAPYDSFGAFELRRQIMVCTYIEKASDASAMGPPIVFLFSVKF